MTSSISSLRRFLNVIRKSGDIEGAQLIGEACEEILELRERELWRKNYTDQRIKVLSDQVDVTVTNAVELKVGIHSRAIQARDLLKANDIDALENILAEMAEMSSTENGA